MKAFIYRIVPNEDPLGVLKKICYMKPEELEVDKKFLVLIHGEKYNLGIIDEVGEKYVRAGNYTYYYNFI